MGRTTADHVQCHTPPLAPTAAHDDEDIFIDDGDDDEPAGTTTHPVAPATNAGEDVDMGAPPAIVAPVLTSTVAVPTTDALPTDPDAEVVGAVAQAYPLPSATWDDAVGPRVTGPRTVNDESDVDPSLAGPGSAAAPDLPEGPTLPPSRDAQGDTNMTAPAGAPTASELTVQHEPQETVMGISDEPPPRGSAVGDGDHGGGGKIVDAAAATEGGETTDTGETDAVLPYPPPPG